DRVSGAAAPQGRRDGPRRVLTPTGVRLRIRPGSPRCADGPLAGDVNDRGRVPEEDLAVPACGDELEPVGRERGGGERVGVPEFERLRLDLHVPELDRPVGARGDDPTAVGAEPGVVNRPDVADERRLDGPPQYVPDDRDPGRGGGDDLPAVGAERRVEERSGLGAARDPAERPAQPAGAGVAELERMPAPRG